MRPPWNVAVPWYRGRFVMFRSIFGAAMLHGVSLSSYVNVPRYARRYFSVVVKRRGPVSGLLLSTNLGKLFRPAHFSTSIFQSVISTDVTMISGRRRTIDDQSRPNSSRFAVKNGRSPDWAPS